MSTLARVATAIATPALLSLPIGCGEPFRVGRIVEFQLGSDEWSVSEQRWISDRESGETDGMHTYQAFLDVSRKHEVERIWIERVIVGTSDGVPAPHLAISARLEDDATVLLAEGEASASAELEVAPAGTELLEASTEFAASSFEFRFELDTTNSPPPSQLDISIEFHSEARQGL